MVRTRSRSGRWFGAPRRPPRRRVGRRRSTSSRRPTWRSAPIAKVSGLGPSAEMIELARWAAWRWAGRLATFLGAASPPTMVQGLPALRPSTQPAGSAGAGRSSRGVRSAADRVAAAALVRRRRRSHWRRLPAATRRRVPVGGDGRRGDPRLRDAGVRVASFPRDWAMAAAGWLCGGRCTGRRVRADPDAGVVRRDRRARRGAAERGVADVARPRRGAGAGAAGAGAGSADVALPEPRVGGAIAAGHARS